MSDKYTEIKEWFEAGSFTARDVYKNVKWLLKEVEKLQKINKRLREKPSCPDCGTILEKGWIDKLNVWHCDCYIKGFTESDD